jgi:hypothetical protein
MPRRRKCDWFIKPRDSATNEIIVSALREWGKEDDIIIGLVDDTGRAHNVYQVPYLLVTIFWRNRRQMGLDFFIYNRQGSHGKVRRWKFQ